MYFCIHEYMLPETGTQKAHSFREVLTFLALYLLYIHKLQIWTSVPMQNYELMAWPYKKGTVKAITERIGVHTVEFLIHPNGSVMVYVSCSDSPLGSIISRMFPTSSFFLGGWKTGLGVFCLM
jgi:hypothetical protein